MPTSCEPLRDRLLLIEDNAADAELARILLANSPVPIDLKVVKDGIEASDFLFKRGKFEGDTEIPDLMLLDLNIPKKEGPLLLQEIKSHPELCRVPVVVVTTSNTESEVRQAYCLGASAFITKPVDITQFQGMLEQIVRFYFQTVRLATQVGKGGSP